MRKGLTMALLTVAVAMMGLKAMAAAPVIGDIPSPIVGNEGKAITDPNRFVYVDAIDLSNYVTDDQTAAAAVKWSFDVSGTAIYNINGVGPLTTEDPKNPGAKQINNQVLGGEINPDGTTATLTIRNVHLNPIGGTAVAPSFTGIGDSQVVTLFASDGSTYSQKEVLFYTDMGGADRYSTSSQEVYKEDFLPGNGYVGTKILGTVTMTNTNDQLCFNVALTGNNYALYVGPYGKIELVKNAVYQIRLKMNSSQTEIGTVPFWDVYLDNFSADASKGKNLYGGDMYVMDNTGGANATLSSTTGTSFEMWWAPAALLTPQWNGTGTFASANNIFAPANAGDKDARMGFRVDDLDSNGGISAQTDFGSICLDQIDVSRYDISQIKVDSDVYNAATITDANAPGNGNTTCAPINATGTFGGGAVKIVATAAGRGNSGVMLTTVYPGDNNFNPNNVATVPDNFPCALDAKTLYMVSVGMSADDDTNPPAGIGVNTELPTYELINTSFSDLKVGACGMPKQVSKTGDLPQTFVSFFYSNYGTATTVAQFHAFRPTVQAFYNTGFSADTAGTGDIKIHSIKVQKVSF